MTPKPKETAVSRPTQSSLALAAAVLGLSALALPIRAEAQAPAPVTERLVTVYAGGFGQVWERRPLTPAKGSRAVALEGVSHRILAESLRLSGDGGPLTVRSLTLSRNLLTPQALLQRFLGREIGVVKVHPTTGEERVERAMVLSVANGIVLRMGGRIETGMPGRLVFPDDVGDLAARPRLTATVEAGPAVEGLTLTYLTEGLGWQADYAATLSSDGKRLSLAGWASVANDTGVDLDAGRLRLVAGEVNRVGGAQPLAKAPRLMMVEAARAGAADAAPPQREAQGAVHVYTLAGPVRLMTGERMQVALLGPVEVPVTETLIAPGHPAVFGPERDEPAPRHPELRLSFANRSLVAGGLPLPAGALRVYRTGGDGVPLFAGAGRLSDIPDGETAEVTLGRAFDVTVRHEQTAFKRLDAQGRSVEAAFRIEVKNGRAAPVALRLDETLPGDWTVVAESRTHERVGGQARWTLDVPAKGSAAVTYTVRILR